MPRKKTLLFFAVIISAFVLMSYQSKKGRQPAGGILAGPLNASHAAARSLSDFLLRPFRMMAARDEENQRLKKQVEALSMEKERFQEALIENRRLKELLRFRDTQTSSVATARVIARGMDNWAHTVLIDKGSRDGVAREMAAVTPKGLAGKVISVSEGYATLLLVSDINFAAAVRLQGARKEGVLAGTGSRKCMLKYIPYEEEVKPGDIVITSGLDSLFPRGIPAGYVSKVDSSGKGGNFQYVEVIPFQDDTKMEEALIVR
ncbi:MAG: rod shape-determining protein MreC [Nitrospiraceae bacterium]|nr:rod shape-determining protein MreC [Nitrospiraceae bacterium]